MERMEINLSIMTKDQLKKFIVELEEENKKLKSDLGECECSMQFENDEVGYRKRECKKLKEIIRKAKEFEYDEDGMDYLYQNTEDIK